MHYKVILLAWLVLLSHISHAAILNNFNIQDSVSAFEKPAPSLENEPYNLKLGNFRSSFAARFDVEYNDNINEVSRGQLRDVILRPGIVSRSIWEFTNLNALTLNLNAGYRLYLNHHSVSSSHNFLDLNPGSELAWKMKISDFELKAYDQFRYGLQSADTRVFDTATSSIVGNLIDLASFENRAGTSGIWDLNQLKICAGYSREDIRAQKTAFKTLDRASQSLYLNPQASLAENFTFGFLGSYTFTDYRLNFQNDSKAFSVGPQIVWQITTNTKADGNIFWRKINFEGNGTNGDFSNISKANGILKITNEFNSFFAHSLQLSKVTELGTVTNASTVTALYYLPVYKLAQALDLIGRIGWESGTDTGPNDEQFTRKVYSIGAGYRFNRKLTSDICYSYVDQNSNLENRSFRQNQILLTLYYYF